ncbi:MAG TPA: DinB family protein [Pyrinomonadaceae bacterium]
MLSQEFHSLLEQLAEMPARVRELVSDLTDGELARKPSQKEFSMLEQVCHLRDIEQEGYAFRIKEILSRSAPLLPDIDGEKLARERRYNEQNTSLALSLLTRARQENVRTLSSLRLDQLERTGNLEQVGPITLERLLLMMREHDLGHLKDLSGLRTRLIGQTK